ncbi:unnamed protein product [Cuscuta europaea]|uniref:Uncharacterized protein n=1 Tax=Cuscuta europaea TaxID=41803 RepID=A0A9P0ZWK0_CUSEU|nr:unnamed protein product [Cuscuta europaea]
MAYQYNGYESQELMGDSSNSRSFDPYLQTPQTSQPYIQHPRYQESYPSNPSYPQYQSYPPSTSYYPPSQEASLLPNQSNGPSISQTKKGKTIAEYMYERMYPSNETLANTCKHCFGPHEVEDCPLTLIFKQSAQCDTQGFQQASYVPSYHRPGPVELNESSMKLVSKLDDILCGLMQSWEQELHEMATNLKKFLKNSRRRLC